jgi:hypothetical protein
MEYWLIEFIDGDRAGTQGYLCIGGADPVLKDIDGNDVTEPVSYSTLEAPAVTPPAWA